MVPNREPDGIPVALVTGANQGLGLALVRGLCRRFGGEGTVFIDTNNHGTYRMITAFWPLVRDNGRFTVVASAFGSLRYLPEHLHGRFDSETESLEDNETVMDDYAALVESGKAAAEGWPESVNTVSKIGQVAAARIAARLHREEARSRGILINAACPGLIDTEASRPWFQDMSQAQSPGRSGHGRALARHPPRRDHRAVRRASPAQKDLAVPRLPADSAEPHGRLT